MAENSQAQDRTEQPTEKKLRDARAKGDVPRSRELNTAANMFAALVGLSVFGPNAVMTYREFVIDQFSIGRDRLLSETEVVISLSDAFINTIILIAPYLGLMFLVILCTPMVMGGWVFSLSLLRFDFGKVNPLKGMKRVFGIQGLIELSKAILKFVLLALVSVTILRIQIHDYLILGQLDINVALGQALKLMFTMLGALILVLALLAMIDAPVQLWQHTKKMRMTKKDIKDEDKESNGNPELKQKLRSLQLSVANRRMLLDVPKASVIIVNPTHYSVALEYSEGADAPKVTAKGIDHMAMRIREIALASNVEIFSSPQLARAIYRNSKIGETIPTELYMAVAQILAYVYQLQNSVQQSGRKIQAPVDLNIPESMRDSE